MRFLIPTFLFAATSLAAQDRPNTILVMDGSGSMWGQIDGTAKITIAQEVVGNLLADFPTDQGLGLTVYGHRERGNCTDIETIVAPGAGQVDQIVTAVNGISPLGKTPMTDAVIAAAEALRYTEDSATVILISDGVETCNPDPCAAARTLEETGVDFTAHVIGFDVKDPEALAQMQCIADETGGQFLTAANASELNLAMTAMVTEPEPAIVTATFAARINDENGELITDPLLWTIQSGDEDLAKDESGNPLSLGLTPGTYQATAYRLIDEAAQSAEITISGNADVTTTLIFAEALPTATVSAPAAAPAGSTIPVEWTGPNREGDQIIASRAGETQPRAYERTSSGSPAMLQLPPEPGPHEIHYLLRDRPNKIIASTTIEVTPLTATIDAPDTGVIGETISVEWTGPDYSGDMIVLAQDGGSSAFNPVRTRQGSPLEMVLPTEPGAYEIRYRMQQGATVLASREITVTDLKAQLTAPDTAIAGETIAIGWDGPNYDRDTITIGEPGENNDINYSYTSDGNPVGLQMSPEPGTYEIRYRLRQDREIIATKPITITAPEVSLTAPDTAIAGETITINWTGPDYERDFIAVGIPGERNYINYNYTDNGAPLALQMPPESGDYEIRYVMRQDNTIIATQPITITKAQVSLNAPATATAGETVSVEWTGPDYDNDFIAVGEPGERAYINYSYTSDGNPLGLQMPATPGNYEIRYTLRQDSEVIARRPITVTAAEVSLNAPETAIAGSLVTVDWTGPDYDGDFIAVAEPDARGYENYTYTDDGSPLQVRMPTEPGTYELRYTLRQNSEVIATKPIEVTAVKASLRAPDTAPAGIALSIDWEGPDYDGDYISVGLVGEQAYISYTYTDNGAPLDLLMPATPGDYEIRYQLRQDSEIIARHPITITAVTAQLVAPDSLSVDEELIVGWDGPNYDGDYIGIGRVGEDGYDSYSYTDNGNPVTLRMPDNPGDYELRYFMRQDNMIIGTRPITITK
ncbi:VWA domain-containing protein [Yoonia sp. 2307UL14-13]|uniref:VWA domain-containing protein n=1 Tax=Yoonia sp. 2307UL14-13 TaxID=3126506 RepID=UPI0030A5288C